MAEWRDKGATVCKRVSIVSASFTAQIVGAIVMTGNTYNEKIAAVSFLGALSVVLIHINVAAPMGTFSWWVYQLTANGFCRWAVPFFFAVSGYFLAARVDDKG